VVRLEVQGERVVIHRKNGRKTPLVSAGGRPADRAGRSPFRDLRTEQPILEDVFLNMTGREMRE